MTSVPCNKADGAWVDVSRHATVAWWAVHIGWSMLQVVILVFSFYWGLVAGGFVTWELLPRLLGIGPGVTGLAPGGAAGVVAGLMVNHNARRWVQRVRLRRLRTRGTKAVARIAAVNRGHRVNPGGSSYTTYDVHLHWTDPVTGTKYRCQRCYRFTGRGPEAFERAYTRGAEFTVWVPPHRPSRAVIDSPFTPRMADLLL